MYIFLSVLVRVWHCVSRWETGLSCNFFVHTLLEIVVSTWMTSSTAYLWGVTAQRRFKHLYWNYDFGQGKKKKRGISVISFPLWFVALCVLVGDYTVCMCPWCSCPPTECVSFGSVLNAWHFCNNHRRKVLKSNFWKGLHVFLWFQTSCFMLCFELVCSY